MKSRILVIAESIDVEDSSGTKGRVALIENLKDAGYDLRVYHYTRKEVYLEGIQCFNIKEKRGTLLFFLSRTERYLRYLLKLQLNKPLEKLFGFSFTLFNDRNSIVSALKKIKDFEPNLVLTLSKGGSFRPHHALLRMPELHCKWIAYIHDPYPAHLYPRPFAWVEPGYFKKWEFVRDVTEKAALCAFPSKLLLEWMESYFPAIRDKGIVIPHQLRKEELSEVKMPEYIDPELFNILHAGNLLGARNPLGLIRAFKKFIIENPEAKKDSRLIFVGNSDLFNNDLKRMRKDMEDNLCIRSYEAFKTVRLIQQNVSVNVILEAKSEISPFLPGKFPHCVEANKPVLLLGPALSESKRLLGEDYPYWAEITDETRITQLLTNLYHEWKKADKNQFLDRPDLERYLSVEHLQGVMRSIKTQ